jgi:apolipoprotein N-acyltransferase
MLFISVVYFTGLLSADFIIIYKFTGIPKWTIPLVFCYILVSRIILTFNPWFFPFYWTLSLHLLPGMGAVSKVILPVFLEALILELAVVAYMQSTKQARRGVYLQLSLLVLVCCFVTPVLRRVFVPDKQAIHLECGIVQGSFTKNDYDIVDKYPGLAVEISSAYRQYIEDSNPCRLLIVPESAFPQRQEEQSLPGLSDHQEESLALWLQTISTKKDSYILANIALGNNEYIYNAATLFNPQGILPDTYIKKNTTPLYESRHFTTGNASNTFKIDNYNIAPLVCYDTVFLLNYYREKTPDLYIALSNDVFAEGTILTRLHQAYGVINARTMGIPFIQATQNGPSFYVDSKGTLHNLTKPYEKAIGISFIAE